MIIGQTKDCFGQQHFENLSKVMLALLSFPHSNAKCEHVFSIVKKTRAQFRASMTDNALEKNLIARNTDNICFETEFSEEMLKKAKSCTYAVNYIS